MLNQTPLERSNLLDKTDQRYQACLAVLRQELIPAMGCTEPIAVAYAAAVCRDLLKEPVHECALTVSGPIIKNVKSVVVPNTGGRRGLEAAVAAGICGGNASAGLEVVAGLTEQDRASLTQFLKQVPVQIIPASVQEPLYIDLTLFSRLHSAHVIISGFHTNLIYQERDGLTIFDHRKSGPIGQSSPEYGALKVETIWDFVNSVEMEDIHHTIQRFLSYNLAISQEGLTNAWGAQIGRTLMMSEGTPSVILRARAAAAAGSDARMSGCELPVVIVSGSGNQGITASLPVWVYAQALGSSEETLYRALTLSALIAIHQKTGIGRISAFCGAVCAGVGAGCGIAYLHGADLDTIQHTIVNALGILSGMVCDGAKPSCAAKISAAVDAGITGYLMYRNGQQFYAGDGIIKKGVENTIRVIGELASQGMCETDRRILEIMVR